MKFKKLLLGVVGIFAFATNSSAQVNVALRSTLPYPGQTCANICGYVDTLGNEYALVGAQNGMSIVDVTDPTTPVEVLQVAGISNLWREIKVRGKYAYVTTEGGGGLQIINMSSLPNTLGVVSQNWAPTIGGAGGGTLGSIHALHIDNNFVYLYGSNLFNGGALVADITDPWNPVYAGNYQNIVSPYIHDGYVRNDTMYGGHIYDGFYSVVDFTNKSAPVELANQNTPNNFTHNTWLSQNSKTLFTTDETANSYLTAYDISNLSSINELDRIQANSSTTAYVHNVHIINVSGNDYAVTSWYTEGFTITDVGRPQNMVEVGNYDTYAALCGGEVGAWGVYPFLPSGTIVVSNIYEGLFVFTPTYVRACYLEGVVTDFTSGLPITGVKVEILTTQGKDLSTITGDYKTGIPSPGGTYSVMFSKPGYNPTTITGVTLSAGVVTNLNATLGAATSFAQSGQVKELATGSPIANAQVRITSGSYNYQTTTDLSGNFNLPTVFPDVYDIIASKWGYEGACFNQTITSSTGTIVLQLAKGYFDDFSVDLGWTVSTSALTGAWERGVPLGTNNNCIAANPGVDDATDCSNMAYVTGNTGLTAADDDVDGGSTILTSPVFDLTAYTSPTLQYSRWFYNGGGSGSPNDSLKIYLNNGISTVLMETVLAFTSLNSTWVQKTFNITGSIAPTANMKVIVRTADAGSGHIVEAGFDKFYIGGSVGIAENISSNNSVSVYPSPFTNETTISYELKNKLVVGASIVITDITGKSVSKYELTQSKGSVVVNPSLTTGVYFVRIFNGDEITKPVKILKMK